MIIHTVQRGDNILSIAKKYGVSPVKIIEYNCLPFPDRLMVGQKILVVIPTRTYTVRGGDTVSKVCRRFGIKKNTLLANNPSLHGKCALHGGTELSIHFDLPQFGFAAINGYMYENTSIDRFRTLLPYLTYITFCYDTKESEMLLKEAVGCGKIPLLRMRWLDICAGMEENAEMLAARIRAMKDKGYYGIALTAAPPKTPKERAEEIALQIKKMLLGMDMLMFREMEAEDVREEFDAADGLVLLYEKCHKKTIPSFDEGEIQTMEKFSRCYEPGKAFVEFSAFGFDDEKALTMEQIQKISIKYQAEYGYDAEKMVSFLDYTAFKCGEKKPLRIHFESLENVKAKLVIMHELGFMGAAMDIGRIPISTVMMMYIMFARGECPYAGIFGI